MRICSIIILFFIIIKLEAQKTINYKELKLGSSVHVETKDGNDFIGTLQLEDSISVRIKTEKLGEISIQKMDINLIEATHSVTLHNGLYWYENTNAGRYLFAPSAYNLRKGEGYYQNIWVFMNQVSYGFTNHFTCGLGVVPFFLFSSEGIEFSPIWVTPKYVFGKGNRKFNFSTGVIVFFIPFGGIESTETAGILYGLGTYGNRNNNLSIGLGWGFASSNEESLWGRRPTINISGMYRLGKSSYFVTENWFTAFGDGDYLSSLNVISGAYRYSGKNASIDLGLFRPIMKYNDRFTLPWLGVTIPFGKRHKH